MTVGRRTNRRSVLIYRKREEARRAHGGRCQTCGSFDALEMAHVKETKLKGSDRGSWERAQDWLRHPDAYVLLCHDCHLYFDGKSKRS